MSAKTLKLPAAPNAEAMNDEGSRERLQPFMPLCVTVKVLPAIVSVPVLEDAPGLDCTAYVTVAVPVRLVPEVTMIHGTFEIEVHPHEPLVVTVTDPVALEAPTFADWLLSE